MKCYLCAKRMAAIRRLYAGNPDIEWLLAQLDAANERADEAGLRSIEARNPGIDIEQVRRQRAAHSGGTDG